MGQLMGYPGWDHHHREGGQDYFSNKIIGDFLSKKIRETKTFFQTNFPQNPAQVNIDQNRQ